MKTGPILLRLAFLLFCISNTSCDSGTQYANPNVRKGFADISKNDDVRSVYSKIGEPIFLTINPDISGNGGWRLSSDPDVSLAHVEELCTDQNKRVTLVYSQPKRAGVNYRLYSISLVLGKVSEITEDLGQD